MYSVFGNGPLREFPQGDVFLVASGDSALAADATALINEAGAGSALVTDGQLAVVDASNNTTITAGDTVADIPVIKVVQGNANSANFAVAGPVDRFPFKSSHPIDGRQMVAFSGKAYSVGNLNAYLIGDASAAAGQIPVADETAYNLNLVWKSPRNDKYFSTSGLEALPIQWTTPDYTTLGLNAANSLAHFVENFAYRINQNSSALNNYWPSRGNTNKKVLALAVDISGGAGTSVSTATSVNFADLKTGTAIPVATINGTNVSITNTAEMQATFTALVANTDLADTSTVEIVTLSTAGDGTRVPDHLLLLSLDNDKALATDTVPFVRTRMDIGLATGFKEGANPVDVESVGASEGSGQAWKAIIDEDHRARLQEWSNQMNALEGFLQTTSDIDPTANYNFYVVQSTNSFSVAHSHTSPQNQRLVILVPTGDTTTIASLNAKLAPWLNSVAGIKINTFASAPALF